MKWLFRLVVRPPSVAQDVDAEIEFHLAAEIERLVAAGVDPAVARREAERSFGDLGQVRRGLMAIDEGARRDERRRDWWGDLSRDLREAIRLLRKSPGFAAVAIVTLGLGIGATTAIFSVVDAVLLRSLPYRDADQLVFITRDGDVSIPDGVDWRASATTLQSTALFLRSWDFDLVGDGEPERVTANVAEPEFLRVLGVEPILGRPLDDADNVVGGPRVALLHHAFWITRFGGDPAVIGRSIRLSDHPTTIIGVLPPEADVLRLGVDLVVPVAVETPWAMHERGTNNFDAIGRLAPGATLEQARAELRAISERLAETYPRTNRGKIVEPMPLLEYLVGSSRATLPIVLAAVGLLLGLACVNLAGLLVARTHGREPELAVRAALGTGRSRVMRQVLTEGLLLGVVGGVLGLLLAWQGTTLLLALLPQDLPRAEDAGLDARVLGLAVVLCLVSGVAAGILPAWRLSRANPAVALTGGRGGTGRPERHRLLATLVATEVTVAVVLLVGAGLVVRSLLALRGVPLGFVPAGVLVADLVLPEQRYGTAEAQTRTFQAVVERLQTMPGVEQAAYVTTAPLSPRGGIGNAVVFEGRPDIGPEVSTGSRGRPVLGEYFATVQLPIRRGRAFTPDELAGRSPAAIINEQFAREFFAGRDPLGARIAWRDFGPGATFDEPLWMTIVGVVSDVKATTLDAPDFRAVYTPYAQRRVSWQRFGNLVVRTRGDPAEFAQVLRQAVWSVDPTLVATDIEPMERRAGHLRARHRFNAIMLGAFALAALGLAMQGIYGIVAFAVGQRRRELGIRTALGARPGAIWNHVLRRHLAPVVVGLAAGLTVALGVSRFAEGALFGVGSRDPASFILAPVALAIAALVAAGIPTGRAARIEPIEALRSD